MVAHMLLEEFTNPLTQCTRVAAKRPEPIPLESAVAYRLAGPGGVPTRAGAALAAQLSAQGGRLLVPVLLAAARQAQVTDFSTGG